MNGQHFTSSGYGNETPTPPSNSSYAASLSSHSSRDPSPHSREFGSKYVYNPSYDQKPSEVTNHYPVDSLNLYPGQNHPGMCQQKPAVMQHHISSCSLVKPQMQGDLSYTNHPNYNTNMAQRNDQSENFISASQNLNTSFSNPAFTSNSSPSQINNSVMNIMSNKNEHQTSTTLLDNVNSKYQTQPPLNPLANSIESATPNIPSINSTNHNLGNISSSKNYAEEFPTSYRNNNSSRCSNNSLDNLDHEPPSLISKQLNSNLVNVSSNSFTNITDKPVEDSSKNVLDSYSSEHSLNVTQTKAQGITDSTASSAVLGSSLNSSVGEPSAQNLFAKVSPASWQSKSFPETQADTNMMVVLDQQNTLSQNLPLPFNPNIEKEETGSADATEKYKSMIHSQTNLQSHENQPDQNSHELSRLPGQGSPNRSTFLSQHNLDNVQSSAYNPTNASQISNLPQKHLVMMNNSLPNFPRIDSSVSNVLNKQPEKALPPSSYGQSHSASPSLVSGQMFPSQNNNNQLQGLSNPLAAYNAQQPPTGLGSYPQKPSPGLGSSVNQVTSGVGPNQPIPTSSFGSHQQLPPSNLGSHQPMPPSSLGSQRMPPSCSVSNQQIYTSNLGSHQPIPPTSFGSNKQMPPSNLGSQQQLPPSNVGSHQQMPSSNSTNQMPPSTRQQIPLSSIGLHQQIPASTLGSNQFLTPPISGSHQQSQQFGVGSNQHVSPYSIGSQQQLNLNLGSQQMLKQFPSSGLQHKLPPGNLGTNQISPSGIGSPQQFPPSSIGFRQQMPHSSVVTHNQIPPGSVASYQQVPQASIESYPKIPPTNQGAYQQMSSSNIQRVPPSSSYNHMTPPVSSSQLPPLPPSARSYQPSPSMADPKNTHYGLQNQNQNSALQNQNQYGTYQNCIPPVQTQQPMATGGPYGMGRYPAMQNVYGDPMVDQLSDKLRATNVTQDGFNRLWGMDAFDLLKTRNLLPRERHEMPEIRLNTPELYETDNCNPDVFRCTLSKIPESKSLLDKCRLPLGVLIHPFRDLNDLNVIQCSTIVRCRACRTYINPFVYFVDNKRWKCNLCFRVNELPEEFQFDPISKTYGDPSKRPEIKSASIEFIAPSEYMVRPPQPATYLFLLDVSRLGAESGYLKVVCQTILDNLDQLPGDARTSVGFIAYDSYVRFYSLAEGMSRPHELVVVDIEDVFLPCPENLLVNLNECRELVHDLLEQLPNQFSESFVTESALGAALQTGYKLLAATGGRITVFQTCLPNVGPGALTAREDPSQRSSDSVPHLNPSTDFYKKLALDCSSQQIAVDLFLLNSQYVDIASLCGISKFSGGCIHHIPLFRDVNKLQVDSLSRTFKRYLTRKIGFESVMRLRCTRGLSIHSFHGNFFVRSTDLLSLPNVNPDAGFGMQVSIDENLSELKNVFFQAALLYTSSRGERKIRVHTLCLPIASNLSDIMNSADQYCIIGLLAKMAVDRSVDSSVNDAREAFVNVVADILSAYKLTHSSPPTGTLLAPKVLRLIPMYILSLLKSVAFRTGVCTRLDDRVFAMNQMKNLPLTNLLLMVYPDLYPLHCLEELAENATEGNEEALVPQRLHLSSEKIDSHGVYLLNTGSLILIYVGHNINPELCRAFFGVPSFSALPQEMYEIPELKSTENTRLRYFVRYIQFEQPFDSCLQIIRDDSQHRGKFLEHLIEDKNEAGCSYYEFIQRIKVLMK